MMLFENRLVDDVINEAIFRFGLSFIPKDIRLVSCALRLKARNTAFFLVNAQPSFFGLLLGFAFEVGTNIRHWADFSRSA